MEALLDGGARLQRIDGNVEDLKVTLSASIAKLTESVDHLASSVNNEQLVDTVIKLTECFQSMSQRMETFDARVDVMIKSYERSVPIKLVYLIIFTVVIAFSGGAGLAYIKMLLHLTV